MHSPRPGDPERAAILNALRVPVEKKLGQPVIFDVQLIRVLRTFAGVIATPRKPNGHPIDYRHIPEYESMIKQGAFDDGVQALLELKDGRWRVLEYDIGATDFSGEYWAEQHHVRGGKAIWEQD